MFSRAYNTRARGTGDLMFISVVFNEHEGEYCYLSDDDTIRAGDQSRCLSGRKTAAPSLRLSGSHGCPGRKPIAYEKKKTAIWIIAD